MLEFFKSFYSSRSQNWFFFQLFWSHLNLLYSKHVQKEKSSIFHGVQKVANRYFTNFWLLRNKFLLRFSARKYRKLSLFWPSDNLYQFEVSFCYLVLQLTRILCNFSSKLSFLSFFEFLPFGICVGFSRSVSFKKELIWNLRQFEVLWKCF